MSRLSSSTYNKMVKAFSIRDNSIYFLPDVFEEDPKKFIGVPLIAKNKNNRSVYVIFIPEVSFPNLGEYYIRTFPTRKKAERFAHDKYLKLVYVTSPEWGEQHYYDSKEDIWEAHRETLLERAEVELKDELYENERYAQKDVEERAHHFMDSVIRLPIWKAKQTAKRGE